MPGVSFKVYYNETASRFLLPQWPTWTEFLEVIDAQITNHKDIFVVPSLPEDFGDCSLAIGDSEGWEFLTVIHEQLKLVKLTIQDKNEESNGNGPADSLCDVKEERNTENVYKTTVKYEDEDRWCPFSQFSISCSGDVKLGSNTVQGCHFHDPLRLQWDKEGNQCGGDIIFHNSLKETFKGTLYYPNDNVAICGEIVRA
uniref:Uncharacterized protein n=1 Tax=Vannella robusta TaxID=1487602 RepID=A0A7S4MSC2_9EUKA|mmetsp:Transcript_8788/g.10865  ORF Transcript_8788/g.10865 Transcript_8788/m.10865 type:complete len:199 (+) Transcript_8788:720-1316(+)